MPDKEQTIPNNNTPRLRAAKHKRGRNIRRIIIILVAAGLVGGGLIWWRGNNATPAMAQDDLTEFTVTRGTVTHTVSGPGTVSPVKIFTVATNLTGDILEDFFEEGDEVEKDSLLFLLDGETTSLNFDSAKDTLANAQDSYQSARRNKEDLSTYVNQSGLVSALYVKKGDYVNSGGKIADIIDADSLLLTLPFNSADAAQLRVGESALVILDDFGLEMDGYVRKVMSGQSISATGALVTDVEIVFANPGALSTGGFATAVVGDYACNNVGQIEFAIQDAVYAAGSGKIVELTVSVGDRISAGQKILTVENSSVDEALTRAAKSVGDAQDKLTNTQNNLQIKSPIAGAVLAKSAKAGDTLYNTSTTLAVVADMSCLVFTIEVDELEIRYVEAGQQATVTADAYEGETFAGIVTNVGKTGTASSGVTTYPVTIEIAEYGGLLPGMNVNADITVRQAVNVLYIPVDAVSRGNMVLVKTEDSGQSTDARADFQTSAVDGDGLGQGEGQGWPQRGEGQGEGQGWPQRGEGQGGGQPPTMGGEGQDDGQSWPQRGEGQDDGQGWPQRGEGQGEGQDWPQRGEGQGEGQGWPQRGEGQGEGQGWPQQSEGQVDNQSLTVGDEGESQTPRMGSYGQGENQQRTMGGDGQGGGIGFMGAAAPEGYEYRRVETGISDSNYVEIISGLNEGDIIAYRPSVRGNDNMDFMFMGPGGGGVFMGPGGGGSGGAVIRQNVTGPGMPGGR